MELTQHITSRDKEAKGVSVEYEAGTNFLIASPNSPRYRKIYGEKLAELRRKSRNPSAEQIDAMLVECYAEAILVGWEGVLKNGEPFAYTKENAKWVLENSVTIRDFVFRAAQDNENFKIEQAEAAKATLGET